MNHQTKIKEIENEILSIDNIISNTDVSMLFISALMSNNMKTTMLLINSEDIHIEYLYRALLYASKKGYLEIVKILLANRKVDPTINNNYLVERAIIYGYTEIVKVLLTDSRVNILSNIDYLINVAAINNYMDILRMLQTYKKIKTPLTDNYFKIINEFKKNEKILNTINIDDNDTMQITDDDSMIFF